MTPMFSVIPFLATLLLGVAGIVFLQRRRWWIGSEFLAVSLVLGLWNGPTFDALLIWLAIIGLGYLMVTLFRGWRESRAR